MLKRVVLTLALIGLTNLSCSQGFDAKSRLQDLSGVESADWEALASPTLQIVDESGVGVAGARILIGSGPNKPFPGNELVTDQNGRVTIPDSWSGRQPVTIRAPGFVTVTFQNLEPKNAQLKLSVQEGAARIEIIGRATEFGRLRTDGKVDFGLAMPALQRSQILNFDVSAIVSPESDQISIIGNEVNIPSNLSLPRQTENYIFPITLDKPEFRVITRRTGNYKLTALHGQFPMQRVVDDVRGGRSIFAVINHFSFLGLGLRDVQVSGDVTGQDIPINQYPLNAQVQVQAPEFSTERAVVAVALTEQGGLLLPSDVKSLEPKESKALQVPSTLGAPLVISALTNKDKESLETMIDLSMDDFLKISPDLLYNIFSDKKTEGLSQLSFALMPAPSGATVQPQFVPLVGRPQVNGSDMSFEVPTLPNGLQPMGMYVVYSEIETTGGDVKVEKRTRLWEVWQATWVNTTTLPQMEFARTPGRTYRWEVMFLASTDTSSKPGELNKITHVSRNALDLQ